MATTNQSFFKNQVINGRSLWALITVPTSLAVLALLATKDRSDPDQISDMIQFSVRCSVPWLYLAFATSSVRVLFPGAFSLWALRNRTNIGLCFASGMAWQLLFILWMVLGHFPYYLEEVYLFEDVINQIPGYLILFAMTLTSFKKWRKLIGPRAWKILHKGGIYFLWATVCSTYWYELYYYDDIQPVDYLYFWAGVLAFGLRVAAWVKPRVLAQATA